jgi:replicative DNA helicase
MDDLFIRQMPHSAEGEQAVLGSILIDSRCVSDVVAVLKPSDFYIDVNREIFEVVCTMFNYSQPIDAVTLLDQMKQHGIYKANSQNYLIELMNITPTAANVLQYAKIVRDKALLRGIAEAASEISTMVAEGAGDSSEVLEAAERKIYALRQGKNTGGLEPVSAVVGNVYKKLGELAKTNGGIPGLPTGISDLDEVIMGLNKSDLILLASRPGVGKTSIALNIALHIAKTTGKNVAYFSLEMSKEQLVSRLLSSEAFVDSKKLMTGRLSQEDWRRIAAAAAVISRTGFLIDDNALLSVSDINAQCRRVDNLGLVVIDYLQLMQSAVTGVASESRLQAVSDMSRMMKLMAKELDIPVLCLCQLSRASAQRTDKRPVLSDLRESGSLEQDADIVLGLYRDDYYNRDTENRNTAECIVMKNRHGSTGTIELQWLPEYTTYTAVDKTHSEE